MNPGPTPSAAEPPAAWIRRYAALRRRLALVVAAAALVVGTVVWGFGKLFSIRPGKGTPVGACVRTDAHVAVWIRTLEPYVPSLHRDGSRDRFSLAVLVAPLDGTPPQLVPVHTGLTANETTLARILGSDGRRLWIEAAGTGAIDLVTFTVVRDPGPAPAGLPGATRTTPDPMRQLAAGCILGDGSWLGLHTDAEVARDYGPRQFVRRVVGAEAGRAARRFHRATLEPDASGRYFRVASIAPLSERTLPGGAFVRPAADAEPLRLTDPAGALVVFGTDPGPNATLSVARATDDGTLAWQIDTGLDRFTLQQILPGTHTTAFVGTRPRVPDRVPEPLLVLVRHADGATAAHSLWR